MNADNDTAMHASDRLAKDMFRSKPYSAGDVVDILNENGYPAEILEPYDEQTVMFTVDDVPFLVNASQIPSLIFEFYFPLRQVKLSLDSVVRAAHDATRDSFLAKVLVDPGQRPGEYVFFSQAECIADTSAHLRNNIDRYIDIVMAAAHRFLDNIHRMEASAKSERKRQRRK
ncbi:MAG: hypothetical protein IKU04_05525 [Bacteroidales bacterium]|nr:hypothetical protein [Bacteroidales bacterium]